MRFKFQFSLTTALFGMFLCAVAMFLNSLVRAQAGTELEEHVKIYGFPFRTFSVFTNENGQIMDINFATTWPLNCIIWIAFVATSMVILELLLQKRRGRNIKKRIP